MGERKSYVTVGRPDGTYSIETREGGLPAGTIAGVRTMDQALDESARLNAIEAEKERCENDPQD
jgi:hypothetical protein